MCIRDRRNLVLSLFWPVAPVGEKWEGRTGHVTLGARGDSHRVAASSASSDSFGGDLPPEKVKNMQRKTLGLMFASYTSIYFVRKPFSVVKAPMQDALNLSTGAIAGIDSAFLGLYAIGQLTLPSLGDKLGARKMLVVGYLLSAAACFGFGLTSFPILLVRVVLSGEKTNSGRQ